MLTADDDADTRCSPERRPRLGGLSAVLADDGCGTLAAQRDPAPDAVPHTGRGLSLVPRDDPAPVGGGR